MDGTGRRFDFFFHACMDKFVCNSMHVSIHLYLSSTCVDEIICAVLMTAMNEMVMLMMKKIIMTKTMNTLMTVITMIMMTTMKIIILITMLVFIMTTMI